MGVFNWSKMECELKMILITDINNCYQIDFSTILFYRRHIYALPPALPPIITGIID